MLRRESSAPCPAFITLTSADTNALSGLLVSTVKRKLRGFFHTIFRKGEVTYSQFTALVTTKYINTATPSTSTSSMNAGRS